MCWKEGVDGSERESECELVAGMILKKRCA